MFELKETLQLSGIVLLDKNGRMKLPDLGLCKPIDCSPYQL
jgi:hypothetical protein